MRKRIRRGNCSYCNAERVEILRFDDETMEAMACENCRGGLKKQTHNMNKEDKADYLHSVMSDQGKAKRLMDLWFNKEDRL